MKFLICLTFVTLAAAQLASPIIGVFTMPMSKSGGESRAYLPASYVKWIESSGGRVVPLLYGASNGTLDALLKQVNGVLFIGGGAGVDSEAQYTYDYAVEANSKGDYFPVWGTCDGFEWILQMQAHDYHILDRGFDSENISMALDYAPYQKTSRILGTGAPQDIVQIFGSKPVAMNNHVEGMKPATFASHSALTSFFEIVATNKDRKGVEFISLLEAKGTMPVWASQFHPEKNAFEMGKRKNGQPYEAINHDAAAIEAAAYLGRFFVNEARKNTHAFSSAAAEMEALIYNYSPVYSEPTDPGFVQKYEFTYKP